jgi:archaellum component FlaF (FlaF/FlaG flagellin family)
MFSLSDSEEILAVLIALAIIIGFIFSTYKDIISTISEEKEKLAEKKEVEEKVKTLINYLDAKTRLVNLVNKQKNKIKKEENE